MESNDKKFLILDSSAILYRAYYALPKLTDSKGRVVNAVYGFLSIFLKIVDDTKPDFLVAAIDLPGPTFRKKMYTEYKATRQKMPDELKEQIPLVKEFLSLFRVSVLGKEGDEADDIIASLCCQIDEVYLQKIVLTGDKDLLQLIGPRTKVSLLKTGVSKVKIYDENSFQLDYHFQPSQFLDFKSLIGDTSDNIPGVPGIGPKTAFSLVNRFKSLDNLYNSLENKTDKLNDSLREKLIKYKDQAFLSRKLASLKDDIPFSPNLDDYRWGDYNKEKVVSRLEELGFRSLIKRLNNLSARSEESNLKLF